MTQQKLPVISKTKQALSLLGLAFRAGKLVYGTNTVENSISGAQCLVISEDSGNSVLRNAAHLSHKREIPAYRMNCSKEKIGRALGKDKVAILAVTDKGFSEKLRALTGDTAQYVNEGGMKFD